MSPRIAFIVEQRYLRQGMPRAAIEILAARGLPPDVLCPQEGRFDPASGLFHAEGGSRYDLNRYDLVVARSRDAFGLAMLAYCEAAGIPTINTYAATERVRNKAQMTIALERAGIPCGPTVLATDVSVLAGLPQDWFPLLIKATYGDNSQGLRLIRRPDELGDVHWPETLVLAQHYLPNDGFDLKLYVCGGRVFATRKPSPFNGNADAAARPVRPTAALEDLALRCGRAFGLDIYGVDTIETPGGPAVIEVNEFPNFTAVPDAATHIVHFVLSRLPATAEAAA